MPNVVLLGPQRLRPTLASIVDQLEISGPIAAVTAGWQERETEDDELRDHLGGRTVNLELYRRAEEVFADDAELAEAHRLRQERIRELQELYRLRLAHALEAARALLARDGDSELLRETQQQAIESVRALDAEHLHRLAALHADFDTSVRPLARPAVERHRAELRELLEPSGALAVAGGHVAVLFNRLRLFGVLELAGERQLLAWSAGAMVLAEQIVVFHDNPPQGSGNAEVLERGLAAYRDILPLPHARRRLRLDDERRVKLFSRRFAPLVSVPLDEGVEMAWNGAYWAASEGVHALTHHGAVAPYRSPTEVADA